MAWYIKPLFGLITDAFPLFGTRRRWYMIGSALLAAGAWQLLNLGRHGSDTMPSSGRPAGPAHGRRLHHHGCAAGGSRAGLRRDRAGQFCEFFLGRLLAHRRAHWAAGWRSRAFGLTAGVGAGLLISLAVAAFFLLKEQPVARRNLGVWAEAGRRRRALASRTLWAAAGLLVLFFFSPGFSTPLLYRQQNLLHFSDQFLGYLQFWSGGAAMLGAATYGLVSRRFNLRTLLFAGIAISAAFSLLYLGYHPTHLAAIGIGIVVGFFGTLGVLPLFDLATRATPRGGEGMGYALMMSARNLALFGADWVGSYLQDHFHLPWNELVFLNAGTTVLCLIAVPFLPRLLMRHRDGEDLGDAHSTGEQISGPAPVAMHSA